MLDFKEHAAECEAYLSAALGVPARLARAEPLAKSTRAAPWRLEINLQAGIQSPGGLGALARPS